MRNIKPIREVPALDGATVPPLTAVEEMRKKMMHGEGLSEHDLQGLTQLDLIALIEDPFGPPGVNGLARSFDSPANSKEWKKAVVKVLRTEIAMRLRRGAKQLHGWGDA